MNTLDQMKVALGEPLKKTIGGVELEFYPLPATYLPDFYEIAKSIGDKPDNATKEDFKIAVNLVIQMVKQSFPKDTPDELINQFVMKHYSSLQEVLTELHTPESKDSRKAESIKAMRERFIKKNEQAGQNQEQNPQQ